MTRVHLFFLLLALTTLIIEQTYGCSWSGHCISNSFNDYNDCADDLICGLSCPSHGCNVPIKLCQRPPYGRRRRDYLVKTLHGLYKQSENN
jgi:hypothetical protein